MHPYPAQGCLLDLEDVFAEVAGAQVLTPTSESEIAGQLEGAADRQADLFVPAINTDELVRVLRALNRRRSPFRKVYAYIFDSFLDVSKKSGLKMALSRANRAFSKNRRALSRLDHLFVPISHSVGAFADYYQIPVSYLPMAADVEKFGTANGERSIDVNAYGRQNVTHVHELADVYNRRDSRRMLWYTSHASICKINDLGRHRAVFWKLLGMSRIALAYDPIRINPYGSYFPYPFAGQRWFESLAAGCVVVGYRPRSRDVDELFDWEDSTIECPEDAREFVGFIEDLLQDVDRLSRTRFLNYYHMLLSHDWGYRVEAMIETLGLDRDRSASNRRSERLAEKIRATGMM